MLAFFLLIYLALCFVVGFLGTERRSGYLGTTALAVIFTPFLVYLGLFLFEQDRPRPLARQTPEDVRRP
ncbi:MAG: hypothetical protein H2060_01990 [Azoarcus sp.]|jgi:hypothetical protein|nr:hypothetical protein [Azoarcus sp.]